MQPILATGWLQQKGDGAHGCFHQYKMTYLDESHLSQMMTLQEVICQNLQRPDLLKSFPFDFMKQHMGRQGIALGVFIDDRLIGFRNMYYPKPQDREWNLGIDLGLTGDELSKVVNLQLVCVHPDFRGNRLAMTLNRIALQILRKRETHPHVCATVSPYNIWNIPVLLASGFQIAKLKNKYGGKVRYVVHQHLFRTRTFDDSSAVEVILDDLDTQKRLLDAGFYGVQLNQRQPLGRESLSDKFNMVFKRPMQKTQESYDSVMISIREFPWQAAFATAHQ
jgi:hypothetical protein